MRRDRTHLRLVGTDCASPAVQPVVDVAGSAKDITVHVEGVEPGQVCEVLHNGMFSLSDAAVVPDGATGIDITTFSLAPGQYEVSIRFDRRLECVTESRKVSVGRPLRRISNG